MSKLEFEGRIHANVTSRYGTDSLFAHYTVSPITEKYEYLQGVTDAVDGWLSVPRRGKFVAILTSDVRVGRYVLPLAKMVVDAFQNDKRLWLKEIVIAVPDASNQPVDTPSDDLTIVHHYVLVYELLQ